MRTSSESTRSWSHGGPVLPVSAVSEGVKIVTDHVIVREKHFVSQAIASIGRPLVAFEAVNITFENLREPQIAQCQYGR